MVWHRIVLHCQFQRGVLTTSAHHPQLQGVLVSGDWLRHALHFVLAVDGLHCTTQLSISVGLQGMNYIDFVAILPFYLKFVMSGGGNVGFLR